jgi:hypothetical protein
MRGTKIYLASFLCIRLMPGVSYRVAGLAFAGHEAVLVPRYRRLLNQCPHDPLIFLLNTDETFPAGARKVDHGRATNTTTGDLNGGLFCFGLKQDTEKVSPFEPARQASQDTDLGWSCRWFVHFDIAQHRQLYKDRSL